MIDVAENQPVKAVPVGDAARITPIDVLRGFAVLGIFVINIQWMAMIEGAAMNPTVYLPFEGANWWVWTLGHVLVEQKFMTIFSLLFGAGVLLMTSRNEARGVAPKRIHYRRMFFLLLIGLFHAYVIWYGDILVTYALCGMLVYMFRHRSPGFLIVIGLVTVSVSSILMFGFGWSMQFWPQSDLNDFAADWTPGAQRIADDIAAHRGSFVDVMIHRVPSALQLQTFLFLVWGLWRAGGLMLVGMGLHKLGVFGAERPAGFYGTLLALALLIGLPAVAYGLYTNIALDWDMEYSFFYGRQINYWASIIVSMGWIGGVMLLCKSRRASFITTPLAAVGRMALTNYLAQSIAGTLIFYGYGLGFYGRVDRLGQIFIVFAVWILQLIVSPIWLRYFRFGPAEWLWRSLTYQKRQPMRARY